MSFATAWNTARAVATRGAVITSMVLAGSTFSEPSRAETPSSKASGATANPTYTAAEVDAYNAKMNAVIDITEGANSTKISKACASSLNLFVKAINELDDHPIFKPNVLMKIDQYYLVRAARVASCQASIETIRSVETIPQLAAYYLFASRGSFGPSVPTVIPVGEFSKKPLPARPDIVGAGPKGPKDKRAP